MRTHTKDHLHTFKTLWSVSEFGGLRKHENNPACTKSVRVFRAFKLDTLRKKKNE